MVPYFLEKLKNTPDGDGNLLDNSLIMYGSPMGDSNVHNHKRVPLFFAGHAGGALKGNLHVKAAEGTPMANAMLTVAHALGLDEVGSFGDSTRRARSQRASAGDDDGKRARDKTARAQIRREAVALRASRYTMLRGL